MSPPKNGGETGRADATGGPKGPISDSFAKPRVKRFYKHVSVGEGAFFQILLDGRAVKTPRKRALILPTRALADLVAAEWAGQGGEIIPTAMHLTRFANTAIDAVADQKAEVARDIAAYAGSDLVCYRADSPDDLVALQSARWDPIVAWAASTLNARFLVVNGVMPVEQPQTALMPFASALDTFDAFGLTALHVLMTLTGSALIALAHARGYLDANEAWAAAHVDEDYQISLWGEDFEAIERRAARRTEFDAAVALLVALR